MDRMEKCHMKPVIIYTPNANQEEKCPTRLDVCT